MPTFYSDLPQIDVPKVNLVQFVIEQTVSDDLERPLLIDGTQTGRFLTGAQLRDRAQRFAAGLRDQLGLKHGDVLAIFSPNSIEFPLAILAAHYLGVVATLVSPAYREGELAHQLRNSGAKAIFTVPALLPVVQAGCAEVGLAESSILLSEDIGSHIRSYETFIGEARVTESPATYDDLAFLCYSSGTTGLPKGVKLTHGNLVANLLQWDAEETYLTGRKDSLVAVLPFSHIYALHVLVLNPIRKGIASYILPKFDLTRFLSLIQDHRATATIIVPPIVAALLRQPVVANYDLSSLKFVCSGAAPLSPDMALELCNRFDLEISQGYGLTETSPVIAYARFDRHKYEGAVGRLLPNMELRIGDGEGLGLGETGEIQVRGPNVMQGYLNNEAANENAFTKDGFFRTGDIGYLNPDKTLHVVDRAKELIKYKGFQVPPVELENLLLTHPKVLDCAVIGRQDDVEVTELPTAFVVLRQSQDQEEKVAPSTGREIIDYVSAKVAAYKRLTGGVRFVPEIPKSASGKILRRHLRDMVAAEQQQGVVSLFYR
ncbi:hypothetical protein PYCC9005_005875 [Savitreella phatthalungensis]